MANKIIEELTWRGFLGDTMGDVNTNIVEGSTFYLGVDPTSIKEENRNPNHMNVTTSLHIGHFSAIIAAMHMKRMGMHPIILIGGATAKLGDATGKTTSRPILSYEEIANNVSLITTQMNKLFDGDVTIVNNSDWFEKINSIDFLRNVGQHITVNYLMAKDSVKHRFERDGVGINISEFLYPLIQSYDWLHLYENFGCKVELAGVDQTGNVSTTFELARKSKSIENMAAWFIPLVTDENGRKFGKSEGRAVYLDSRLTTPYEFYQFWLNQTDEMAEQLIKKFTFLSRNEIESLINEHREAPHLRKLQKVLAFEVTKMVHSEEDANAAIEASNALFSKDATIDTFKKFDEATLLSIFSGVPQYNVTKEFLATNPSFIDFAVNSKFGESKGATRRDIMNGALSINKSKITDVNMNVSIDNLIHNKYIILQKGKKYALAIAD